jgi:hypothetical protein
MSDKTLALEHIIRNIAEGKFTPSDEPKVSLAHAVRNVHEGIGIIGSDKPVGTPTPFLVRKYSSMGSSQSTKNVQAGKGVVAKQRQADPIKMESAAPSDMSDVTAAQNSEINAEGGKQKKVKEESGYVPNQGNAATVASWPAAEGGKKKIKEDSEPTGTVERRKVKFVARLNDADPKSTKSTLGKLGQIKTKIVDEEKVIPGLTPVIIDPVLKQISPDGDKLGGNKPQRDKLKKIVKEASLGSIAGRGIGALSAYDAADNLRQGKVGKAGLSGLGMATGPVGAAAAGSSLLGMAATGTETGRSIGKWIGDHVPGAKTAADYMRKAGETLGVRDAPEQPKPQPQSQQNNPVQKPVNKQKSLIKKTKGSNQ